jgi:hypothetical protein
VPRVGGTKWPDLARVFDLAPDLVVANAEENRDEDDAVLRAAGVRVWVTAPATVAEALDSLGRLCAVLDRPEPEWLSRARGVWADPPRLPDEPYAFAPDDGPEAWPQARPAFVSGRHLTWYWPPVVEAPEVLLAQLRG